MNIGIVPARLNSTRLPKKSYLQEHMRVHTGDKPYTCRFCNKIFTQASSLGKHVLVHAGNKPYACSFCDATFTQNSHLQEHKYWYTYRI